MIARAGLIAPLSIAAHTYGAKARFANQGFAIFSGIWASGDTRRGESPPIASRPQGRGAHAAAVRANLRKRVRQKHEFSMQWYTNFTPPS